MTQTYKDITLKVFDKVVVQVSIQKKNPQTSYMQTKLVTPYVSRDDLFWFLISHFDTKMCAGFLLFMTVKIDFPRKI